MCVKASIFCHFSPCCTPLLFYTWLFSNKRSNGSCFPARVPVAFVISVHAVPGVPLPATRAFCGLSASCVLGAALKQWLMGGGGSIPQLPGPLSGKTGVCSALHPPHPPAKLSHKPTMSPFMDRVPLPALLPCPLQVLLGIRSQIKQEPSNSQLSWPLGGLK